MSNFIQTDDKKTILIVDDNPIIRDSIDEILTLSGYTSLTAADGVEALEIMASHRPDLIISDIMMPRMDGYAFFDALKDIREWSTIPFIFLTARGEKTDIRRGYRMGADRYLVKPLELEDLLIAVETRLERAAEIESVIEADINQTKQQLLNVFGHELRTPLSLLHGYSKIIEQSQGTLDKEAADEIFLVIQESVDRLVKLSEDLMLMVCLDSGVAYLSLESVNEPIFIKSILENLIVGLSNDLERRNIVVELNLTDELTIVGHSPYMSDLFKRILENAIKFGRPGGTIWVEANVFTEEIQITIRDNGIGIAPEKMTLLFKLFQQIDRESMEQQGLGLGLAIAARLAEFHGGRISAESELGQGSKFIVHLPIDVE
ncbi:MAG: response regulator [Anaerolineales bacterium]|nr:response regulator [Anaerolineales bacterium]